MPGAGHLWQKKASNNMEFFLGVSLAIVKVTETTYSQFICPNENLAKLSSLKQIISVTSKLASIFLVIIMVRYGWHYCITPTISLFFFISAFYFAARYPIKIRDLIQV